MKSSMLKLITLSFTVIYLIINLSCSNNPVEPNNTTPTVSIVTPLDSTNYFHGDTVSFSATATDEEDGTLTGSSLIWTSDMDGQIGIGTAFIIDSLSENTHKIFITATDSQNGLSRDSLTIVIEPNAPIVTIVNPSEKSGFSYGATITFTGSAIDEEDGDLTGNSLVWTSDKDGQIGTDDTLSISSLSGNRHVITLTATDSENNNSTANVTIDVFVTFEKTIGGCCVDAGNSVVITSDGGYVLTGITASSGAGGYDAYLVKTDINGNVLWERTFGTTNYDYSESVVETSDGGFILTGRYENAPFNDLYIIKTDLNGNLIWEQIINRDYQIRSSDICEVSTGGFVIVGSSLSDALLIKLDTKGNIVWEKTFGGNAGDFGSSILESSDGGFVITGYTSVSLEAPNNSAYLFKTDSDGTLLWEKALGGTAFENGNYLDETSDGGFIITGSTSLYAGGQVDVYLVKTDDNGNTLWEKKFGGDAYDVGYCVQETLDSGFVITGSTKSFGNIYDQDLYLIKTDNNGNLVWEKTFGRDFHDLGKSLKVTSDGGYIITGGSDKESRGFPEVYLIKTDSEGNVY